MLELSSTYAQPTERFGSSPEHLARPGRVLTERGRAAYLKTMFRKPLELPPEIAKAFVRDMRAFHAEKSPLKRDEIASRQIQFLRQFQGKSERRIKPHQVKEMFEEMKDQVVRASNQAWTRSIIGQTPGHPGRSFALAYWPPKGPFGSADSILNHSLIDRGHPAGETV
jgi:hypothetical protein